MPKVKKSKGGGGEKSDAVALADQILQADTLRARGRVKSRDSRAEAEDKYVDERLSRKILQQARIQQEELQTEYGLAPEKKKSPVTVLGNVSRLQVMFYTKGMKLTDICLVTPESTNNMSVPVGRFIEDLDNGESSHPRKKSIVFGE